MFWNLKNKADSPVWRDKNGKITCPGDSCPQECDDRCPIWLNTCGLEKLMASQPKQSINYFKRAIALAADFPDAYNNLGTAYGMSNMHREAYDAFCKALELRQNYPQALYGRIVTEKNLGQYSEALKHCDEYERLTGKSIQTLRNDIKKLTAKNVQTEISWASITQKLLEDGRKAGFIQSNGFPNIPEIMAEAERTCKKVMDGIWDYCTKNPNADWGFLSLVFSAYAGMGAVYHWNLDWPSLASTGIYETLTKERGLFAMDEYVMDSIGMPHQGNNAQQLTSYLKKLVVLCISEISGTQKKQNKDTILIASKAMFAFGMVFEMNRLGMY